MDKNKKKKGDKMDAENKTLVKNTIDINPTLHEQKGRTVVFGWGRMNPVTIGHEKLADKLKSVAKQERATPLLYLSHSSDPKKNPLSYDDKIMLAKKAFGNMVQKSTAKTIIQAMKELDKSYDNVILIVGQDRVQEFETLLNKYNGKEFTFDSIKVVSAGDRDPDADDVTGMSASKMRALAAQGNMKDFAKGLPRKLKGDAQAVYDMVRAGMKLSEELEAYENLDEALSLQQRRQRAITMRRYKAKIAAARKRMARRPADQERLKKRAEKKARSMVRAKIAGEKGKNYQDLSPAEKSLIDDRVKKRSVMVARIAKKLLPKMKRSDMARIAGKTVEPIKEATTEVERLRAKQAADRRKLRDTQEREMDSLRTRQMRRKITAINESFAETDKKANMMDRKSGWSVYKSNMHMGNARRYEIEKDGKEFEIIVWKSGEVELFDNGPTMSGKGKSFKTFDDALKAAMKSKNIQETVEVEDDLELLQIIEAVTDIVERNGEVVRASAPYRVTFELKNLKGTAWSKTGRSFESKAEAEAFIKSKKGHEKYRKMSGVLERGTHYEAKEMKGDDPCWKGYEMVGKKKKNGKEVPNCVPKEEVYFTKDELFEMYLDEAVALDKILDAVHRHMKAGKDLMDITWQVSRAAGVDMSAQKISREYIAKFGEPKKAKLDPARASALKKKYGFNESADGLDPAGPAGAGLQGTDRLQKRYKKDTPGEVVDGAMRKDINESLIEEQSVPQMIQSFQKKVVYHTKMQKEHDKQSVNGSREKVGRHHRAAQAHKRAAENYKIAAAQLPRQTNDYDIRYYVEPAVSAGQFADDMSKKANSINESFAAMMEQNTCQLVGMKQIKEFEKVVDKLFEKFGIDFQFTKHFAERMGDERNDPCITLQELADFIKKIYKNQGKSLKSVAGAEAVVRDLQKDLNIPVVVKYDQKNDEFDVVMKTIMRKKNFRTPNKVIDYK